MRLFISLLCLVPAVVAARAMATDILVQRVGDGLAVGRSGIDDGGGYALGQWAFTNAILPPNYATNDTGFNALAAGSLAMPEGAVALPASRDLVWDFLPMVAGGVRANLLYWNGVGATLGDVAFGLPPTNHSLSLTGASGGPVLVDGTDAFIPGHTIARTSASGAIHSHRYFALDDNLDPFDTATPSPVAGVYLVALRLRMTGLADAPPVYIAFGTWGAPAMALEPLVRPWVEARVDELVPPPVAGDYDGNAAADGADLLVWQRTLGNSASPAGSGADGDASGFVDAGDLVVWKDALAAAGTIASQGAAAPTASAVPEPATAALLGASLAALVVFRRGRRRFVAGLG